MQFSEDEANYLEKELSWFGKGKDKTYTVWGVVTKAR